jgi:phosphopantetheine adenylyltransferase
MATIYVITLTTHHFNTTDFEMKNQYTHNVGAYASKDSAIDYLKYKAETNEYKLKANHHNRIERTLDSLRIKTYEMVDEQEVVYVSEWNIRELELQ